MLSPDEQKKYLNLTVDVLNRPVKNADIRSSISYETIVIFQWVVYTALCQGIGVFGITTNIINIICFAKQGFKDPVNISLLGLAISDLGSLVPLLWLNISFTPAFMTADLPFDPLEFQYLFGGMLHASFTRVTGWITALITMERCFCIIIPLKVSTIVTTKRVTIIVICVFVLMLSSGAPTYAVNRLDWKFFPSRNKTLIGLVYLQDGDKVEKISYAINNAFIPFSSFFINVLCTSILAVKLRSSNKWRKESTAAQHADSVSRRNKKVAKMVVMISTLFIACFIPVSITFMAMSLLPGLSFDGEHRFALIITGGLGIVMESINSSVNIFFYYNMSSKYRAVFQQLFRVLLSQWSDKLCIPS